MSNSMENCIGESKILGTPEKPLYPVTLTKFVYEGEETQKDINKRLWDAFQKQIKTSGTTTIGPDGYWYVDGEKTDIKAQGDPGRDGHSPILKLSDDGITILVSSDGGETWFPFVVDFNKLRVLGYVDSVAHLPQSAQIGDIYSVWNPDVYSGRVDEHGTLLKGAYDLYINTVSDWVFDDNILKVYEYETELPQSATNGTVVVVEERDLTLDKEKIDGYKVYKYDENTHGWVMLLNTSEIFVSKEDILNHGDNVYALVQGDEANKYKLYKRKVEWVFFGTNASITYRLIQNLEEGTTTNILSGKAVRDAINEVDSRLTEAIEALREEMYETYGRYTENPEFVYVYTDSEDRILWGIKTDADIFYGAGIPTQLREYVEKKIEELSLDEYEDIVAFLDGFIGSDTTLQAILESLNITIEKKVDKEEGKSLIDKEYANGIHYIENPEFAEVKLDSEDRILEATMADGTKLLPAGLKTPSIDLDGAVVTHVDNPEFAEVHTDADDRILYGVTKDGDFIDGKGNIQKAVEAGKLGIKVDSENGILTIGGKRYKLIAYED